MQGQPGDTEVMPAHGRPTDDIGNSYPQPYVDDPSKKEEKEEELINFSNDDREEPMLSKEPVLTKEPTEDKKTKSATSVFQSAFKDIGNAFGVKKTPEKKC